MPKTPVKIFGAAGLLTLTLVTGAAAADYWNDRFGYAIDYPAQLYPSPRVADNGDGFLAGSVVPASELRVWGSHNSLNIPSAYAAACYGGCPGETYRAGTTAFGVSSGQHGGEVYYIKCINDRPLARFACFQIKYPVSDKARFDSIVARLAQSLRWTRD